MGVRAARAIMRRVGRVGRMGRVGVRAARVIVGRVGVRAVRVIVGRVGGISGYKKKVYLFATYKNSSYLCRTDNNFAKVSELYVSRQPFHRI